MLSERFLNMETSWILIKGKTKSYVRNGGEFVVIMVYSL